MATEHPLSHVRVLDLSRILAGPWAGQTFADLGAEVIKVERVGSGDDTRQWGPPYLADRTGKPTGESAYYLCANRGKRSVTVDITRPEGQAIVRGLAARSDVLIENYKVGGLARYGLGYDDLKAVNRGLVYCSITGFGQTGPYAPRAGYDFLIQAMGGLMSVTGEADGRPGGGPQKVGVALSDVLTGLYTTIAALAALALRERTGEGQHVDLALLDVTLAAMANQAMNYLVSGDPPVRMGNAHPNIVPYEAFATADDPVILAVGNDAQFSRFCKVAGRPELAADPRYATNSARVENRETLTAILRDVMASRERAHWLAALEAVGVPCGPLNHLGQVLDDPQIRHREMQVALEHPLAGTVDHVASPIRFSGAALRQERSAPLLGEHTDEVLRDLLDYDEAVIGDLRRAGVI